MVLSRNCFSLHSHTNTYHTIAHPTQTLPHLHAHRTQRLGSTMVVGGTVSPTQLASIPVTAFFSDKAHAVPQPLQVKEALQGPQPLAHPLAAQEHCTVAAASGEEEEQCKSSMTHVEDCTNDKEIEQEKEKVQEKVQRTSMVTMDVRALLHTPPQTPSLLHPSQFFLGVGPHTQAYLPMLLGGVSASLLCVLLLVPLAACV